MLLSAPLAQDLAAIVLVVVSALRLPTRRTAPRSISPARLSARSTPSRAEHGMVVAQEKLAARIGADILRQGGNAVDAAVAVGSALAVTYPRAGNLGGGGFMVIHLAKDNRDIAIDYRETAPAAAKQETCSSIPKASPIKPGEVTQTPGSPISIQAPWRDWRWRSGNTALASSRWRSCSSRRSRSRATASSIADDIADTLPRCIARGSDAGRRRPRSFSRADGTPLREGDTLVQARSCGDARRRSPNRARAASTRGRSPRNSSKAIRDAGGIMTLDDLKSYQPIIRAPVRGSLSRLRHRLDAAAVVRRHRAARDAEHPRRLSDCRPAAGLGGLAASDDRGDEARLCRPRRAISAIPPSSTRRSNVLLVEGLCRQAARRHRSRARHASGGALRRRRRAKAATPRISRWSTAAATPSATPIR